MPYTDLHSLESDYCSLPLQAVCCSLGGLKPKSGTWTAEATSHFKQLVGNKIVKANVEKHDLNTAVLTLQAEDSGETVNQQMIQAGFASLEGSPGTPPRPPTSALSSKSGASPKAAAGATVRVADIPPPSLPEDSASVACIVVDAPSPNKFYIQIAFGDNAEKIQQLDQSLQEHYANVSEVYPVKHKGEVAVAKYIDNKWYRVEVLKIMDAKVHVHFLDYGNDDDVDIGNIRAIDTQFLSYAVQTVCCSLPGVGLAPGQTWNPAELMGLGQLTGVIQKRQGDMIEVELQDLSGTAVSKLLIGKGLLCEMKGVVLADSLPKTEFPEGNLTCILTEVQGPDNFYLQLYEPQFAALSQHCRQS